MNGVIYYTNIDEKFAQKNMEHMIGEKLLEIGLWNEYGKKLKFEPRSKGEFGKPFFSLLPKVHYNISHSGKYVVCALAGQEIGIDIQMHKKVNYGRMLKKMVPQGRAQEILSSPNMEELFFEEWVLREAYVKWTGQGLSRNFSSIPMEEGWHTLLNISEGYSMALWAKLPMEIRTEYVAVSIP